MKTPAFSDKALLPYFCPRKYRSSPACSRIVEIVPTALIRCLEAGLGQVFPHSGVSWIFSLERGGVCEAIVTAMDIPKRPTGPQQLFRRQMPSDRLYFETLEVACEPGSCKAFVNDSKSLSSSSLGALLRSGERVGENCVG